MKDVIQSYIEASLRIAGVIVILAVIGAALYFISTFVLNPPPIFGPEEPTTPGAQPTAPGELDVKKFESEQDFKDYLEKSALAYESGYGFMSLRTMTATVPEMAAPAGMGIDGKGGGDMAERVSTTNVQVTGIDEPDIVKTDGQSIYFSSNIPIYYGRAIPFFSESIWPYPEPKGETKVIKAFPPEEIAKQGKIDKSGTLLLINKTLVIFGNDISGYDVSNPANPSESWKISLNKNTWLEAARLSNGKIYLVTRTGIDFYHPCPIIPLTAGGQEITVACADIYQPISIAPVDATYTAMIIDSKTGKVENKVSFVGPTSNTIVYMSGNSLYISYLLTPNFVDIYYDFFKTKGQGLVPDTLVERMSKLKEYDISDAAKLTEINLLLQQYISSLNDDEQLRFSNELANRSSDYFKEKAREIGRTEIVKVNLSDFTVWATGHVPGRLLDQFSLDEYQGNLRAATTIDRQSMSAWSFYFNIGTNESFNDAYVLDGNLNIIGSVKDLGITEQIYSVRFVQDKGYIVTFRQVDPFYVLDLTNPANPQLAGELKIPGFSSYLHPITKDFILGVGREGSQVKLSLFDVSNPNNPKEASKYLLDEYWTEVADNHHAFLMDSKHEVFFLPGGKGGYIFSYKGNNLELKRAVSGFSVKRAIYLDDYMYIIGDSKITVLNENNWQEVKSLDL